MDKVLVIGAGGQLGSELTPALRDIYGEDNVIASDRGKSKEEGHFEELDIRDKSRLAEIVSKHHINHIYHLAAILSAKGEDDPFIAWQVNIDGLLNVLEIARERRLHQVYWPSSIAVFGPKTPVLETPQETITDPTTVYGISKLAGERWCEYYLQKQQVDVGSLRYPGLISYTTAPGGGTTDYAVDIFYQALEHNTYQCFLEQDTRLPCFKERLVTPFPHKKERRQI